MFSDNTYNPIVEYCAKCNKEWEPDEKKYGWYEHLVCGSCKERETKRS